MDPSPIIVTSPIGAPIMMMCPKGRGRGRLGPAFGAVSLLNRLSGIVLVRGRQSALPRGMSVPGQSQTKIRSRDYVCC
jgi:hypothetical protein